MTDLTVERLRELLDYDPDTGLFTWRVRTRNSVNRNPTIRWVTWVCIHTKESFGRLSFWTARRSTSAVFQPQKQPMPPTSKQSAVFTRSEPYEDQQ